MPTTSKLVAAVAVAIMGYFVGLAYGPLLPEGTNTTMLGPGLAALGFLVGWLGLGPHCGKGYPSAISLGLRASAFLVFWGLLLYGSYYMVSQSFKVGHYKDVGQAFLDIPQQMIRYGRFGLDLSVGQVLVAGGILSGIVTEFAARRWR